MRGHVRKRGATWAFVVDVGPTEDGRRRQQWNSGFRTKKDAERALTDAIGRLQAGAYVEPSHQTFASFLSGEWMPSISRTVRPSTLASYRVNVERHISPAAIGQAKLQSLTPGALNAFYAELSKSLAPKTVRNIHVIVHKSLSDAARWGRVTRNVADLADPPRAPRHELNVWSPQQLRAFLVHVRSDRLYAAWLVACTTGMRRGEIVGLRWSDVDLEGARLGVVQSAVVVDYKVQISEPKTSKGRRSVALDPTTIAALKEHRHRQLEDRLAWGAAWVDSGLVFTRENGSMIHPEAFTDLFRRQAKAAGLPPIRLHDVRHSYATAALSAGVAAKVVSERLGHATVAITLDTYSHVLPALDERAAETVALHILGEG